MRESNIKPAGSATLTVAFASIQAHGQRMGGRHGRWQRKGWRARWPQATAGWRVAGIPATRYPALPGEKQEA